MIKLAKLSTEAFSNLAFDENFPLSSYYTYDGSFTTPGCEEVVKYIVKADPIKISRKTLEAIKGKITKSTYATQGNARRFQKKNSRIVKFYDKSKSNLDHTINKYIALSPSADARVSDMKLIVGDSPSQLIAADYDLSRGSKNSHNSDSESVKELPSRRIPGPIKSQLENFIQGGLFSHDGSDEMQVKIDKNVLPPPPLTQEILESGKPDIDISK